MRVYAEGTSLVELAAEARDTQRSRKEQQARSPNPLPRATPNSDGAEAAFRPGKRRAREGNRDWKSQSHGKVWKGGSGAPKKWEVRQDTTRARCQVRETRESDGRMRGEILRIQRCRVTKELPFGGKTLFTVRQSGPP